jgi:hypothetical protein
MIIVKTDMVDGVAFLTFEIKEPYEEYHGVPVEKVSRRIKSQELDTFLKASRLYLIGSDEAYDADIYAVYPMGYIRAKAIHTLYPLYWKLIRWLYDNARFFKQIPEGERFSWKYATVYVWYRKLVRRLIQ